MFGNILSNFGIRSSLTFKPGIKPWCYWSRDCISTNENAAFDKANYIYSKPLFIICLQCVYLKGIHYDFSSITSNIHMFIIGHNAWITRLRFVVRIPKQRQKINKCPVLIETSQLWNNQTTME